MTRSFGIAHRSGVESRGQPWPSAIPTVLPEGGVGASSALSRSGVAGGTQSRWLAQSRVIVISSVCSLDWVDMRRARLIADAAHKMILRIAARRGSLFRCLLEFLGHRHLPLAASRDICANFWWPGTIATSLHAGAAVTGIRPARTPSAHELPSATTAHDGRR